MSTSGAGDNNAFITEYNQKDQDDSDASEIDSDASGEQESSNQIFNIREAVPPTDFDAPYSKMPKSVVIVISRVKQKVIESYKNKNVNKQAEERKAALRQRGKTTAAAAQKRNATANQNKNKDL
jgi:hypothetical protein